MKLEAPCHDEVSHCLDCGAAVNYHYCSVCGQETRLHVPSAFEFLHEFVAHYVALEGKLWRTLGLLLFRPGMLSAEYIAGRRARYIQPLRVYLSFSILFFAVLKLSGGVSMAPTVPAAGSSAPAVVAMEKNRVAPDRPARASSESDDLNELVQALPPQLGARVTAFLALPSAEKNKLFGYAFYKYVPYAIFLLMPVFALYLKVLYLGSGRHYGEHLLFALHSNAFAYLMFTLMALTPWEFSHFLMLFWLIAYLPTAMRRVYGGTRAATAVRWLVLLLLHTLSISVAVFGAFGLALLG